MLLEERAFIDAVRISVKQLFSTMIPLRILPDVNPELPPPEVLGTIDIHGQLNGSLSLQLSYPLAIELAARLLQEPLMTVNEEVLEAVAEVTNMIAGGIKTALTQQRQDLFSIGLPQVFDLAGVQPPAHVLPPPWLHFAVPIATEQGAFSVHALLYRRPTP